MRFALRSALALLLAACLISLPVMATPNRAIGFVLQAQGAQLDGSTAINGTNVYAGDVMGTDPRGTLRLQIASSQIYLFGSSAATLSTDESGATTSLTSGTAGFSAAPGAAVAIRALDVTVRPKTQDATHAQVTVNGPSELLVTSFRGELTLELDGQSYSMAPGRTYRVQVETKDQKAMDAGRHLPRNQRKLIFLVFGGAAAAYGGMVLYHELTESPDKP
ncbi:MAG TPA: hypothetical protein VGT03_05450 [Candidatus Acidoferrales bacterium]|nr:hypothetical protein [Candidatus Acidoferrales bacterium]